MIGNDINTDFFIERRKYNKAFDMNDFHCHFDHYEIYFMVCGTKRYLINYKTFDIMQGDIILINKRDLHMTKSIYDGYHERILINFNDKFIESFDEKSKELLKCFQHNYISVPLMESDYLSSVLTMMLREYEQGKEYSSKLILNYLFELLVFINRYINDYTVNQKHNSINITMEKIRKYIYENFMEDLNVDDLAKIACMNVTYFSKVFKATTGVNFIKYLNFVRIREATNLLLTKDLPISDIALSCGFNSFQHFCDTFKKIKGIPASQFRKKFKNNI